MLNSNHVAQIRTCQRVKFDQALYILTMYQKKIRTEIKMQQNNQVIDAEKEYDQKIVRSWNGKWKMDLTKPLLNCVTSVSPRVLLDIGDEEDEMKEETQLDKYNAVFLQFIRRMRAEHEDESNFKLTQIDINEKNAKAEKFMDFASRSCSQFVSTIQKILHSMKKSVEENAKYLEEIEIEDNYCCQIGSRIEDLLEVAENTSQYLLNKSLYNFVASCVSIFDSIKESEHGSTLITVQPKLEEFTYLLHPLFLPIYATFLKEKQQSKAKSDKESKQNEDTSLPFRNFFSSSTSSLTKMVFINLDGYESQFNLQFARCFRRNVLYITFPKEDIHYANDQNSIFEQRLYKKIMYNWEKNKMRYDPNSTMDEESQRADKMYFMTRNVEDYYTNVQKVLYKLDNNYEDLNRNLFVFPLRLSTLNENFNNLVPEEEDDTIDVYESFLILQIFKYFLINQIKEFGGSYIIVSHSGRLNIEDSHFVQIMQELTKLSHYKIVYYPNLSTRFCPPQKRGVDHEMNINNIDYLSKRREEGEQPNGETNISYEFFGKVARFLKVSSGTYSLMKNFEEQSILSKHTNLKVLRKANKLLEVLGNQYENVERIRFKNSEIDLIPKLYEKDAEKIVKSFDKLVPLFYNELYLLLESIISICYLPSEAKPYTILAKYNINPETIRANYIIRQLIFFIQSKIIVRNSKNEADKQTLSLEKIKKYLDCQREKHFLEISQQRYEDSVLLHFKNMSNADLYDLIVDGKPNLSGLIDVSFTNPNKEIKDSLHIYDSTQVLYKLDQSLGHGPIPILIMNHLALEKKGSSKFENYCAFLNREVLNKINVSKSGEQGTEKIYEEKKVRLHLVKFYDEENQEIIESKFEFRTEWNFCETQNYIILFWPQLFNFVEAICYKLQGRTYEPPLLNEYFMAKKEVKNDVVAFYKANVPDNLAPRSGCSTYQFRDFVYIFGGFYDRHNNYLSLQRDVTLMNLSMYTHDAHRKLQISNIKNELYQPITKENEEEKTPNSYVRARRQFQFFDMEDVNPEFKSPQGIKSVMMLGGVGQNFIHPFSLLTYYYYQLKFDEPTGRLLTITKNIIYNRSIPANIRKPSKNMGIIKTPIRNKSQSNGKAVITKPQLTEPHSYARFRIVYKMEQGQLKYKFQYMFSEKDCRMLKEDLKKYDEEKYQVSEVSSIRIQRIDGINHLFMIQKYGSKQVVHMRLDIVDGGNEMREQQFKLTHNSVSYLNVFNGSYVCALVKHPVFTNDRTILADCLVKSIENQNLSQDQAPYVSLKPFNSQLKGDLSLHIIQASNQNILYILHGHRIYPSPNLHEYQLSNNRTKKTKLFTAIPPAARNPSLPPSIPRCCYSTFAFDRQEQQYKSQIICESYLMYEEDGGRVRRVREGFNPANLGVGWVGRDGVQGFVFVIAGGGGARVSLERMEFVEFFWKARSRAIVVVYNRKKYLARISEADVELMGEDVVVRLEPTNDVFIRTLVDEEEFQKGSILNKKPQNYIDRGFYKAE